MRITSLSVIAALVYLFASLMAGAEEKPSGVLPGVTGTVKQHNQFLSKLVAPRNVHVWLPASYEKTEQRYPVLYMHDGQNLFDPKTSFLGVDWGVDEAMTRLIEEGKVQEAIVVGIWNTPKRVQEYLPQKMIATAKDTDKVKQAFSQVHKRSGRFDESELLADRYLKFLVTELKPFIDKEYRTKPDRANTFIMGSSAGGMISLYAISEYPEVFVGAGCVSTHFPFADGLLIDYIKDKLPDAATHKIYFDFGTETLDNGYEPYQNKMDEVMSANGWTRGQNWITRKFPGEEHSERSWRKRVHVPLEFLLKK